MAGEVLPLIGSALTGIGWAFLPLAFLPVIRFALPQNNVIKNLSNGLIQIIDSFNYSIGELIKWALPVLVLSVAFSVFALSIFGFSSTKLSESAEYLHACVIMLGAAATLLAGQHVRVDIVHSRLKPEMRALVDFCGYFCFLLPACLILIWSSQSFTSFSWSIFEGSPESDGIRGEFLLKTLIPVFALMMIMQGLSIALRAVNQINKQESPQRPEHIQPLFEDVTPSIVSIEEDKTI